MKILLMSLSLFECGCCGVAHSKPSTMDEFSQMHANVLLTIY
jgi:hypothetical protein